MSTVAMTSALDVRSPGRRRATEIVIARRAFRQVQIGAIAWAVIFGGTVASTAISYVTTYPTEASRQAAAATVSGDTGLAVLLGPTGAIGTVGGYTVYKIFVFLTTVGAIWALLATTRLLRGEEDTGRWQLVLAGSTRAGRATTATLAALYAAVGVVFVGTTAGTLLAARNPEVGFDVGSCVLYGLSLVVAPAVFVGVGAVTSQVGRTRRRATGLGMSVFAVAFLVRMIADSGPGTQWLLWATPFGWTELMRPFTENNPWPLAPAFVTVIGLGAAAVLLTSRRDSGDGLLGSRDVAQLRPLGLRAPLGLATRLELPVLAAWCVGAVAGAFFFGIIAKLTTADVPPSLSDNLDKFGVQGSFTDQFFAIAFLFMATVLALIPASQVSAAYGEESSGRLAQVLAQPTTRRVWFAGRLALTAGAIAVSAVAAGLAMWLGAMSQGVDVSATQLVGAAANCIPVALVSLGIGAVTLALAPRAASGVVFAVVIWSLVIKMFGSLFSSLSGLQHLSLLDYMAQAPAEHLNPATVALTVAVAFGLCALATMVFSRRDLRAP